MGKIINVQAGNDLDMFQIFKSFVHQTEKNEFFVDGASVIENPDVAVDFRNIEHAYEIFHILGSHWGGWNETLRFDEMNHVAKHWEEDFQAEIIGIGHDSIGFKLGRNLKDREIDELLSEIKDLNAEPACRGGIKEKIRSLIHPVICLTYSSHR